MTTTENKVPEKGMAATMYSGADQYAMVIVDVTKSKKTVVASMVDQREFRNGKLVPNGSGNFRSFRLQENGSYKMAGRHGSFLSVGSANEYRDPNH